MRRQGSLVYSFLAPVSLVVQALSNGSEGSSEVPPAAAFIARTNKSLSSSSLLCSKVLNRQHRNRVNHLLMELRIGFTRSQSVGRQQIRIIQVYRTIVFLDRGIVVEYFKVFPYGALPEFLFLFSFSPSLFPSHFVDDVVDLDSIQDQRERRIERVPSKTPIGGGSLA